MDKQQTGQGGSGNSKEAETLALDLTMDKAASIFMILQYFIGTSEDRIKIINENSELTPDELTETLAMEDILVGDAQELCKEVGEILVELDKPKPLIIKPNWHGNP